MKKVLPICAGLAIALFAIFTLNKRQIAEAIFANALEKRISAGLESSRPDGLHVIICGAGAPMPNIDAAGPCTAVIAGDRAFVFDVGSGSPRKLGTTSFPMNELEGVFLTHLHSDHIDSLGELMLLAWITGTRSEPLPVYGPAGTKTVVEGFNAAYRIDSSYRTDHHGSAIAIPSGFGGTATEIEPGLVYDDGGVKISVLAVRHHPVEPAFAYRIDYKGRSVSISGDTVFSEDFAKFSEGVDVMLHEALQPTMITAMRDIFREYGVDNNATIMDDILDYHTSPEDAAKVAQLAGAQTLILHHIVPPLPVKMMQTVFLGTADQNFDGKIHLAEDGMLFSLPANSDVITQGKEF